MIVVAACGAIDRAWFGVVVMFSESSLVCDSSSDVSSSVWSDCSNGWSIGGWLCLI